ncbi:unnamed protein product, partial [Ascophyllum nodosum]
VQVQQSAESDIRSTVTVTSPTSGCVRTLDFTALNAMPALRHLDVSNNVLRR